VLPHYLPAQAFAERSRAAHAEYALVAARLAPEKGIDTAIEAAALADIPLRVAGEGPAAEELVELANLVGGQADFVGRRDRAGIERELAGAAMVLMPSRYHEFSPYSALEAMAAGVPVIASALGGLRELLGTRRCVPAGDAAALAGRMTALWESPGLRRSEGDELIAKARAGHGEQRYVSRLLEIYTRARQ